MCTYFSLNKVHVHVHFNVFSFTCIIEGHLHVYDYECTCTVGRLFFEGYKFREFRDFLKIRENYFRKNQNNTVQDGRRHKFTKIKSAN